MTGRRTWTIATRADPSTPIVRVHFRRPWYLPWSGRVDIEPLTDEGAEWAEVVEFVIRSGPVHDLERRRFPEPPHTRSARRVELALGTISAGDRALICYAGDGPAPPHRDPPPSIPPDWLRRRLEVAEVEAENVANGSAGWTALKGRMREGDEVWEFESPPESWRALRGRSGYALVRSGEPIDAVITHLS